MITKVHVVATIAPLKVKVAAVATVVAMNSKIADYSPPIVSQTVSACEITTSMSS